MVLCTLFTTAGQVFFKLSSATFQWNPLSLATNYPLLLGLMSYGLGALLLIRALSYGKLSIIYPFVSLTFIWVTALSVLFFQERIGSITIAAILLIILGIFFIGGSYES